MYYGYYFPDMWHQTSQMLENQDRSVNRKPENIENSGEFERSPHFEGRCSFGFSFLY